MRTVSLYFNMKY